MKVLPLTIKCPKCGSGSVAYSCDPDCCFNHVCEDCLDNFQLATHYLGRSFTGLVVRADRPDSCAPTTRCSNCQSLDVWSVEIDEPSGCTAACLACGAALALVCQ
jgi:hypothetical protein